MRLLSFINKLGILTILTMMCFAFAGCSHRNKILDEINKITRTYVGSSDVLLALTNGSPFEQVTNALKGGLFHEFTVSNSDGEFLALGCRTSEDFPDFWLLFCNNKLVKIIGTVAPEMELYPYQGATASRIRSWDVDDMMRINKTINSPSLTHGEIFSVLSARKSQDRTENDSLGDLVGKTIWNYKLKQFNETMALKVKKDYEINENLVKRYDGFRIKINMDSKEVSEIYGEPKRTITSKNGQTVRIFGDERNLEVSPKFMFSYVAVVFNATERVTSVYSHDFFDEKWKSEEAEK